ncbi:hypothetical protein LOTGIDRAFT_207709 [Lottia gigantea]|uniref:Elongator complex protein 2 n=1 Tax=Lottia gigantea TaxID=225164 RepID=V4B623_LOTGI|nr:hypothetical protein LOTGIDRAFT_207709 [Lottia gigantea]ESP01537.1 hypothetical protein LOTGIDRAFT_207709 [Lottia gigantea]
MTSSCNKTCHAADWGYNDLICFGSCNSVLVYQPEGGDNKPCEILESIPGHTDRVNCVQWIQNSSHNNENEIVSGSVDKTVRVWSKQNGQYVEKACLKGHTLSVNAVCGLHINSNSSAEVTYIASSSTDSTVKIWRQQCSNENGDYKQAMSLLSASMDKTMILWQPETESNVWVEKVRVGEVGGNTLGFYGGMFSPDGLKIIAHGYQGAFHHWSLNQITNQWNPSVTGGGHFESVEDIDWDRSEGEFLLSTSADQTTRLHAPWVHSNRPVKWYEIARPQVHGYDLQCLTMITRYKFATGADEKVARESSNLAEGASVPALGLSNKAVYNEEKEKKNIVDEKVKWGEQYPEVYFHPQTLSEPPSEENLLQNTLWPESQKLYGHGYEIFSIACDYHGQILATACKASKSEYANIILWDVETWKQIGSLTGCSLTVTRLAFSHSNQYLLAVSRDRTWSLYSKSTGDGKSVYENCISVDKKTTSHTRIIWDCCWTWDDRYFFTASRDKKVMVWSIKDLLIGSVKPCSVLELQESVTAVDVAPQNSVHDNSYLVSIGLDSGKILLYKYTPTDQTWYLYTTLPQKYSHHLTIKRLKFRPRLGEAGEKETNKTRLQLASCSLDHSVRIYTIHLDKL